MNLITPFIENNKIKNTFSFIFTKGEHTGEKYEALIDVACENPTCTCGEMDVTIYALDKNNKAIENKKEYQFWIDVKKKALSEALNSDISIRSLNFAKSFVNEMTENDWSNFDIFFYSSKVQLMEDCDIDTLDVSFHHKDIENGIMVAYSEIFPYGKQLHINIKGTTFIVDEQFCLRSKCSCADPILAFFKLEGNECKGGQLFSIQFDYEKNTFIIVRNSTYTKEEIFDMVEELKKTYTDLSGILKKRHSILKKMYRNYINKNHIISSTQESITKYIRRKRGRRR